MFSLSSCARPLGNFAFLVRHLDQFRPCLEGDLVDLPYQTAAAHNTSFALKVHRYLQMRTSVGTGQYLSLGDVNAPLHHPPRNSSTDTPISQLIALCKVKSVSILKDSPRRYRLGLTLFKFITGYIRTAWILILSVSDFPGIVHEHDDLEDGEIWRD
ncbi:hypothetical protein EW146_g8007 [Bondarzewia mesenterica]|uniref:Uncharacterized protein n=1 Tax=Bondarzewia mesenterica TaxID=1095465 RepID=A0A4V3XDY2_9AGAM|nr:hypothetical protein EW146_g8007 [Bondarzewia mesenterica]